VIAAWPRCNPAALRQRVGAGAQSTSWGDDEE